MTWAKADDSDPGRIEVRQVTWGDALAQARRLTDRCVAVRATAPGPLDREEPWLALPIYALAGETGLAAADVPLEALRYRLEDPDRLLTWLCAQLQRMGHHVTAPPRLDELSGRQALVTDLRTTAALLRQHDEHELDPVAWYWRAGTRITADETETTDGTVFRWAPSCTLWSQRALLTELLDDLLVLQRGGWPRGTRVRTHGIPPYASPTGTTAAEAGVFADRAVVHAPHWALDHGQRVLAPGPPAGYWLRYRSQDTGLATTSPDGPVAPAHLTIDLEPHDAQLPPARTTPAKPTSAAERAEDVPLHGPDRQATEPSTGDPSARYRAAALTRLWELRDRELRLAGDSTPARIAERILQDPHYPTPPTPPTFRTLTSDEAILAMTPRPPRAPGFSDQHLVTGEARQQLLQWLPEVVSYWSTRRQKRALDGFHDDTTLTELREFLALEGFREICDVHGNAGPAPTPQATFGIEPPSRRTRPQDRATETGDVDLVLCSHEGFLATLHAPDIGDGPKPSAVDVSFNVATVDEELFDAGAGTAASYHFDDQDRRANIRYGRFRSTVRARGGSLRVQLAVLRTFAIPVTPWRERVLIFLGRDNMPREHIHQIIAALPEWVHTLIGPQLQQPKTLR